MLISIGWELSWVFDCWSGKPKDTPWSYGLDYVVTCVRMNFNRISVVYVVPWMIMMWVMI